MARFGLCCLGLGCAGLFGAAVALGQERAASGAIAEPLHWVGTQPSATQSSGATSGTTLITHGFQLDGQRPDWPLLLAAEIAARIRTQGGTARVLEFLPNAEPALAVCSNVTLCGPSDADGHAIVAVDWAQLSNQAGRGFSEAAGEAVAAVLLAEQAQLDLSSVHLIGHSRGPVVNSEIAERLIAFGFGVEQMTVLDLHDWGVLRGSSGTELVAAGAPASSVAEPGSPSEQRGGLDDFDVNELHPEYDCGLSQGNPSGVCSWQGIAYVDSYYQADGLFDLWGRQLQGASNLLFDGLSMGHSDVHCWYRATVSADAPLAFPGGGCDESDIAGNWFTGTTTCGATDRDVPLARDSDGYNFSAAGLGSATRCPGGSPRQEVLFDPFLSEGLVNGDFEKGSDAGWMSNGGQAGGDLQQDDDWFVRLSTGDERRHGWAYVPDPTWALQFSFRVVTPASGSELVLEAEPYGGEAVELWRHELSAGSPPDWQSVQVRLPEALQAQTVRFGFRSVAAVPAGAEVDIDDVLLVAVPAGLLFVDGFESGSTDQWSGP